MTAPRLTLRIDFPNGSRLGPGKIALLEAIGRRTSISAAARDLSMSYRRAWLLVDDLNRAFDAPVVATSPGRAHGGGATLTAFGVEMIATYRRAEIAMARATAGPVARLTQRMSHDYARDAIVDDGEPRLSARRRRRS